MTFFADRLLYGCNAPLCVRGAAAGERPRRSMNGVRRGTRWEGQPRTRDGFGEGQGERCVSLIGSVLNMASVGLQGSHVPHLEANPLEES